ncbi:MAG: NFACT RNA binding domain-containing protein [Clostridia bacterium]
MAYDSLSVSILTKELNNILQGGKITKIFQPEKDEIILNIFNKANYKLLISVNPSINHIHLVDTNKENPKIAPTFCMLLRKYLTNASISSVTQMPYERLIEFTIRTHNELGYEDTKRLIVELTGKTGNIILVQEDDIILDTLKRLPLSPDSARILLSGAKYTYFEKRCLYSLDQKDKIANLIQSSPLPIDQLFKENLLGLSTQTVDELLFGVDVNLHTLQNIKLILEKIDKLLYNIDNPTPNILFVGGAPSEVYPFDYLSVRGEKVYYDTLNIAHEQYYELKDSVMRFRQHSKAISTTLKNTINRTEKKIGIYSQEMQEAQKNQESKIFGDLILSNLHLIGKNDSSITTVNYYEPNCQTVTIPLDVSKTPQQNAQEYYKKYRKLKNTITHSIELIEQNKELLSYCNGVVLMLNNCSTSQELNEIYQELVDAKLIKGNVTITKNLSATSQPLKYQVGDFIVRVGKNNYQNEQLVKTSKNLDLWLHTQQIHSSHAVISTQGREVPQEVLTTVGEIVTYYSPARNSGKTVIDYTLCKNLKKPPHARTGYVIYSIYNSLVVCPCAHAELLIK